MGGGGFEAREKIKKAGDLGHGKNREKIGADGFGQTGALVGANGKARRMGHCNGARRREAIILFMPF